MWTNTCFNFSTGFLSSFLPIATRMMYLNQKPIHIRILCDIHELMFWVIFSKSFATVSSNLNWWFVWVVLFPFSTTQLFVAFFIPKTFKECLANPNLVFNALIHELGQDWFCNERYFVPGRYLSCLLVSVIVIGFWKGEG